jgi:hypothetical protein
VIAIRDDGTSLYIQGSLPNVVADSFRATLLGIFRTVLIEDEQSPVNIPAQFRVAPPESPWPANGIKTITPTDSHAPIMP